MRNSPRARLAMLHKPDHDVLSSLYNRFVKYYLQACGTQSSRTLLEAFSAGNHEPIVNATTPVYAGGNEGDFFREYMATSLLKKSTALTYLSEKDRNSNALSVWTDGEQRNWYTNHWFKNSTCRAWHFRAQTARTGIDMQLLFSKAQSIIKSMIGPKPPALSKLAVAFGPGSTSACSGQSVTVADKLLAAPHITYDALPYIRVVKDNLQWFLTVALSHPGCVYTIDTLGKRVTLKDFQKRCSGEMSPIPKYWEVAPTIVNSDSLSFAPKNAKTSRVICITAGVNAVLQKMHGTVLAKALANYGLGKDLTSNVHRVLARQASLGELATLDVKNASGTMAYEVVMSLLPPLWGERLAELRAAFTTMPDGTTHENEMFSGMGNGFTFELETILFYSLVRAAADITSPHGVVSVFGDDIIIPRDAYDNVVATLACFGFEPNLEKSFRSGGFAESCGGDFLKGQNVRPYFLKEKPLHATDIFTMVNGLYRVVKNYTHICPGDDRYLRAWLRFVRDIPLEWRFQGPPCYGDAWIHTDVRSYWTVRYTNGLTYLRGVVAVPQYRLWARYDNNDVTKYACALYGVSTDGLPANAAFALRGERLRSKVKWINVLDDGFAYRERESDLYSLSVDPGYFEGRTDRYFFLSGRVSKTNRSYQT